MEVVYLGHAGFVVKNEAGNNLLIDPWLSRSGVFLRSWFQFPENHFMADKVRALDPKRTILYISHQHRDHFDPAFLWALDKRMPVVVPRLVRSHFLKEIHGLGFDVQEVDSQETVEHLGFRLIFYIDESYSNEDSGVLIESDGARFLNMKRLSGSRPDGLRAHGAHRPVYDSVLRGVVVSRHLRLRDCASGPSSGGQGAPKVP